MGVDRSSVVLTKSEAACLKALGSGLETKSQIAIAAKLDLPKTSAAMEKLERLGFATRDEQNRWHPTEPGASSCFKTVADKKRRNSDKPGRSGERLLKELDRPMRGEELAARLGLTRQRVHQLVIKLYSRGYVRFADGKRISFVARRDDPTALLSRDEARVLSVIPHEFATSPIKVRLVANVDGELVNDVLARLLVRGLIEKTAGPRGDTLYQITAAGLAHPQYDRSLRRAEPPRLPVESDRVLDVLSLISTADGLRIRDVSALLGIPLHPINALFQYLKRKSLVQKCGQKRHAPYTLTDQGRRALAEMVRQRAA